MSDLTKVTNREKARFRFREKRSDIMSDELKVCLEWSKSTSSC